jgi:hypothetical protein
MTADDLYRAAPFLTQYDQIMLQHAISRFGMGRVLDNANRQGAGAGMVLAAALRRAGRGPTSVEEESMVNVGDRGLESELRRMTPRARKAALACLNRDRVEPMVEYGMAELRAHREKVARVAAEARLDEALRKSQALLRSMRR